MLNVIHWNVDPVMFGLEIPLHINIMLIAYGLLVYLLLTMKQKNPPVKIKLSPEQKETKQQLNPEQIDPYFWEEYKESSYRGLGWILLGVLLLARIVQYSIFHNISFGEIFNPINIPPKSFSMEIRWYSFGFLFAFALGYIIISKMFKKEYISQIRLGDMLMYLFFGVLVGARLGHCLFYEPEEYFQGSFSIISIILPIDKNGQFVGFQGLASHGAAIGIIISLLLFWKKYKMNPWWIVDRLVIVIALGGAFIRLGNLFNSEIYGDVTSLPWGFVFERNGETQPKHPTQLYEALSYFLIFAISLWYYIKKKGNLVTGKLFGWWLVALFGARFFIEFLKEPQVEFEETMLLDMGQILSIPFILAGLAIVWMSKKGMIPQYAFLKGKLIINLKK